MLLTIVIITIGLSIIFLALWIREKKGLFVIRIGKRGSSILVAEMDLVNDEDLVTGIIRQIQDIREYNYYIVCSGMQDRSPNKTLSDREYFLGRLTGDDVQSLKTGENFKDLSIFMLNEEVEDTDKILLTHDLIVNTAQIPDRELLLESGFIITLIKESNLIVITGVRGEFEKVIINISDTLFTKNRRVVLVKM